MTYDYIPWIHDFQFQIPRQTHLEFCRYCIIIGVIQTHDREKGYRKMLVYLVRHGEALSREEDPKRPLSEKGALEVEELAGFIAANFEMSIGVIHHSGKARAAQTASILSRALAQPPEVMQSDGLDPMDDPGFWSERLSTQERDTMLVGHLPHLSRLTSLLLTWNPEVQLLEFNVATVVCLDGAEGNWLLKWLISPGTLKQGIIPG